MMATAIANRLSRFAVIGFVFLALAGCGLKIPDPAPFLADCPAVLPVQQSSAGERLFFVSSALPDCREDRFDLSNHRRLPETFGIARYDWRGAEEELGAQLLPMDRSRWLSALQSAARQSGADGGGGGDGADGEAGEMLVFIHGFNTRFREALDMAAHIVSVGREDVPGVVIHWPSRGFLQSYAVDEANLAWAQGSINAQLARLSQIGADITVVAHSMGARAAIDAVLALDRLDDARGSNVKRLVLASGDIDRDQVLRTGGSIDQVLRDKPRKVLIYSSYRDAPLALSRQIHGHARLGSSNCLYDTDFARHALGKAGDCHRAPPREGLKIVETSHLPPAAGSTHSDFLKACRARAHFAAFLKRESPLPFEKDISTDALSGFEIDPLAPDPEGLCPDEESEK